MPLYSYQCKSCEEVTDEVFPLDAKPQSIICPHCKLEAHSIISFKGGLKIDQGMHYSKALGKIVKNDKELKAEAKARGLIPMENASPESIKKWSNDRKQEAKKKFEKELMGTLADRLTV